MTSSNSAVDIPPCEALDNTTLVIPSNRNQNYTAQSAPDWMKTIVRDDEGRSIARNRGVMEAETEWIVLADDDITFPTNLTARLVSSMHQDQLVGIEDFWPFQWVLTRYMVFHRSVWERVDGFDESREHGEDTDFAIRCEKAGVEIYRLPRRIVPHHDIDGDFSSSEHSDWLWYLIRRHPLRITPKAVRLIARRLGLTKAREDYSNS